MSTAQTATARRWIFTLFDPIPADPAELWNPEKMNFLQFQAEMCPTTNRLHLQGMIILNTPMKLTGVKKLLKSESVHVNRMNGSVEKNLAYTSKEDTRVQGPWTFGEVTTQGKRNDIAKLAEQVMGGATMRAIATEDPGGYVKYHKGLQALRSLTMTGKNQEKRVAVLWGPTGAGKTRIAYDLFEQELWRMPTPTKAWFDGYDNHRVALLDECGPGMFDINLLKQITDRYPMLVEVKGGTAMWCPEVIILTSNLPIENWYSNATVMDLHALKRRMKIFELPQDTDAAIRFLLPTTWGQAQAAQPSQQVYCIDSD